MGQITDIEALDKSFIKAAKTMIDFLTTDELWLKAGYKPLVVETKRELSTQMAYYSRGRMDLGDVQKMFRAANLWSISKEEAIRPSTWTLESKHIDGRAIDIGPSKDGKRVDWKAPHDVWAKLGYYANVLDLEWGGSWKGKEDNPHVEMKD